MIKTAEVLEHMTEEYMVYDTGDIDLLKTFQELRNKFALYGIVLEGKPCDVCTWEGYIFYQPLILRYLYSREMSLWS